MDRIQLVFGTGNLHKVQEVKSILAQEWLQIVSSKEVGYTKDVEETGTTMRANASLKSQAIYQDLGGNVFSEDSGLEVISLGMAPGVISARYAGPQRSHADNIDKLLSELKPGMDRTARFRSVISLIWEGKESHFEGVVNGRIAHSRRGDGGFGYDPVFIPYGYDESFAELPDSVKNSVSHRYRAIARMKRWLLELRK